MTSVPRTIFDLAAFEDVDAVVSMLREAEYRNLWDRLSLWDLLGRYPRKRGSRKVRVALERLKEEPAGRKRSPLEERFSPFLRRHRLPLPRDRRLSAAGYTVTHITWSQLDDEPEALSADLRVLVGIEK